MRRWVEWNVPPATAGLLAANGIVYALFWLLPPAAERPLLDGLPLSGRGLQSGLVWQPLTYLFVHASFFHLLINMFSLYVFGPELEVTVGRRHFLLLYALSGVLGGIGFVLLSPPDAPCVGASGSIFGLFAAFAAFFPRRRIALLFLPMFSMEAWFAALLFGGLQFLYLVTGAGGQVAYAAHVAGAVAGYVYARTIRANAFGGPSSIAWGDRRREIGGRRRRHGTETENIDDLLDKIARDGIGSLTARDRRRLEEASRQRRGLGR
jgi:membrane associated rhomboid family serine protease